MTGSASIICHLLALLCVYCLHMQYLCPALYLSLCSACHFVLISAYSLIGDQLKGKWQDGDKAVPLFQGDSNQCGQHRCHFQDTCQTTSYCSYIAYLFIFSPGLDKVNANSLINANDSLSMLNDWGLCDRFQQRAEIDVTFIPADSDTTSNSHEHL